VKSKPRTQNPNPNSKIKAKSKAKPEAATAKTPVSGPEGSEAKTPDAKPQAGHDHLRRRGWGLASGRSRSRVLQEEPPPAGVRQSAQGDPHLRSRSWSTTALDAAEEAGSCPTSGHVEVAVADGAPPLPRASDPLRRNGDRQRPRDSPATIPRRSFRNSLRRSSTGSELSPASRAWYLGGRHVRSAWTTGHNRCRSSRATGARGRPAHYVRSAIRHQEERARGFSRNKKIRLGSTSAGTQVALEIDGRYQEGARSVTSFLEQVA